MRRGNIVSITEPVRREETPLFHVIPISKPWHAVFWGREDAIWRCFFVFFWLPAYLTSRYSIAVAGSEKGFGMTVAKGSLNKLQAASPGPPETQASRCIPAILLPEAFSFCSLDQEDKAAALRIWDFFFIGNLERNGIRGFIYCYRSGAVPWDPWDYTPASPRKAWRMNRREEICTHPTVSLGERWIVENRQLPAAFPGLNGFEALCAALASFLNQGRPALDLTAAAYRPKSKTET